MKSLPALDLRRAAAAEVAAAVRMMSTNPSPVVIIARTQLPYVAWVRMCVQSHTTHGCHTALQSDSRGGQRQMQMAADVDKVLGMTHEGC